MPLASFTERRKQLRAVLAREAISSPISVWDATSARLAKQAGWELGLLGGSVASHVVLGAPDLVVLTLAEMAEQCRRICFHADIPLLVDSDHGYGNALNVRRTIEELELAGVAGLNIEDTVLPRPYGNTDDTELIPVDEFRDKLRAAVDARNDPELVIIGRTQIKGMDETLSRVQACIDANVDVIFLNGRGSLEMLDRVHAMTKLPLILNRTEGTHEEWIARGGRVLYLGHQTYYATLQNVWESYQTLLKPDGVKQMASRVISPELQKVALAEGDYQEWQRDFLNDSSGSQDGPR
jgi:carboxyvinyl-carboxyphosphonate phosphorylmutase